MKLFKCQHCGQILHFENRVCESCGHRLGYIADQVTLSAVEQVDNAWQALAVPDARYRFCDNAEFDACNWLVAADAMDTRCGACRHNHLIPNLADEENLRRWRKIELAKHHLFYTLLRLKLPLATRAEQPQGLIFDFLADTPDTVTPKVMTGHDDGLITINLAEADDATRETLRTAMGEPYRTLLGHFRHEIGHYFWDRLVRDERRVDACRAAFGDERPDYNTALQAYYAQGPAANWQENYVSAYASSHPWEDFAETWAHYLHIVDTLEMARAFGLRVHPRVATDGSLDTEIAFDPHLPGPMQQLIDAWLPVTFAVNSLNRCMGQPDLYPFVLSPAVIAKLEFIHDLVHAAVPVDQDQSVAA